MTIFSLNNEAVIELIISILSYMLSMHSLRVDQGLQTAPLRYRPLILKVPLHEMQCRNLNPHFHHSFLNAKYDILNLREQCGVGATGCLVQMSVRFVAVSYLQSGFSVFLVRMQNCDCK